MRARLARPPPARLCRARDRGDAQGPVRVEKLGPKINYVRDLHGGRIRHHRQIATITTLRWPHIEDAMTAEDQRPSALSKRLINTRRRVVDATFQLMRERDPKDTT